MEPLAAEKYAELVERLNAMAAARDATGYRDQSVTFTMREAAAALTRLKGTLEYILAQAELGYPTVLSVIKANAKAALDDEWPAIGNRRA